MAEREPASDSARRAEQAGWMTQIAARGERARHALRAVFDAYDRRTVRRLMGGFRLTQADAEDVWQDALIDLWKGSSRFDPATDLAPWLNTLVNNRARKLLDTAWLRRRTSLDDADGASGQDTEPLGDLAAAGDASDPVPAERRAEPGAPPSSAPRATRNLDADACTDEGLQRFELEHPEEAGWLLARDLEGRDVPSLAAEMGCSEETARKRLSRLRVKLKPFLQHCVDLLDSP